MRRLVTAVLLISSLFILVIGAAGALLSGPDDTIDVASTEETAANFPLITDPVITAFTDVDLVVTAQAPQGVFVGSAHRVDLDDLADGVKHHVVTDLRPSFLGGIGLAERDGGTFMRTAEVDLASLDVWREQSAGQGTQQLVVPLRGEPVGVLVSATDRSQAPVVAFAIRVPGIFVVSLATAALGLLVVAGLWVRRRRRRRGPHTVVAAGSERDQASPRGAPTPARAGMLTALASVSALALAGCAVPSTMSVGSPSKVAVADDDVEQVMSEHGERRVAAIAAARFPRSSFGAWTNALDGPFLESAKFTTRWDSLHKESSPAPTAVRADGHVWSPSFEKYPMWSFVEVDGLLTPLAASAIRARKKGAAERARSDKDHTERTHVAVLTRQGAAEPWKVYGAVDVAAGSPPAPVAGSRSPVPSAEVVERAEEAVGKLKTWWRTGRQKNISVDAESRRIRPNVATFTLGDETRKTRMDFSDWSEESERLRIVETQDGHMAVTTFKLRVTLVNPGGPTLAWSGTGQHLKGQSELGPHTEAVVLNVLHLPAEGDPRVLGTELVTLLG